MRIKEVTPDINEGRFRNDQGGNTYILLSHRIPVAAIISGPGGGDGAFRTSEKQNMLITGHINKWLNGTKAIVKPQSFFDNLLEQKRQG